MKVEEGYPSLVGIGYAPFITSDGLEAFDVSVQEEGFGDFHSTALADGPDHAIIQYIEPFDGVNLTAFGSDMYSEKSRRDAMMSSSSSASPALSRPIKLLQDVNVNATYGSLMYLPVYKSTTPPATSTCFA